MGSGEIDLQLQGDDASGTLVLGGHQIQLVGGGSVTVLNDDPSFPVEVTNDEGSSSGTLTISRFGEEDEITAPADPLDMAELPGG